METIKSRRTLVRVVSFSLAGLSLLIGLNIYQFSRVRQVEQSLEYTYQRSLADLNDTLTKITSTLEKGVYTGTPAQLTNLSSILWRDCAVAKQALGSLPLSDFQMGGTYKFLSQVGEYAMSLSKKAAMGEELSAQEQSNLRTLWSYSRGLSGQMNTLTQDMYNGRMPVGNLEKLAARFSEAEDTQGEVPGIVSGFQDMEDSFEGYPTLIYDGPFSDHIMERAPRMLEGLPQVDAAAARQRAAGVLGVEPGALTEGGNEDSRMPNFTFGYDGATVSVTKAGGLLCSLLRNRAVGETKLTQEAAAAKAQEYLQTQGYADMTSSYYETVNGICTVNFAYAQGDVTVYADLIKVSVALDDGQIISMDARGYLTNHIQRTIPPAAERISQEKARQSVSDLLSIQNSKLVIIPTNGLNETFCYEFETRGTDNEHILVYVNALTGAEEQILILLESESGVLTM